MIVILGPTASGKTQLAAKVAHVRNAEIISADSRQVYRKMNIGTGKDYEDYVVAGKAIPYHLIDVVDAGESYHIAQFQQDFQKAFKSIQERRKEVIFCGGSGMYIDAILRDYQFTQIPIDTDLRLNLEKKSHEELLEIFKTHPSNYSSLADVSTRKRLIRAIEISFYEASQTDSKAITENPKITSNGSSPEANVVFGISLPTELRRERISRRLTQRLENGMIAEVENLLAEGISADKLVFYGLEYKFITYYLQGQLSYPALYSQLETAIHQFAKRQLTYFRGMERKGLKIHWLDGTKGTDDILAELLEQI